MNLFRLTPRKSKAQAMVEFAIVLPILMLLLYGLLEAGRLLFIYSTIVTATRQAVRYGSATGLGVGGTVPRYQDCQGIRAAANRTDFLNSFDHTSDDITIAWDNGPTDPNPPTPICGPGLAADPSYQPINNNTRLLVTIEGDYLPIVPRIVPFLERTDTSASGPITSESARTVLLSVSIQVTIPPSTYLPSSPTFTPSKTPTPTPTPSNTPTFTPSPTPVFTNTPTVTPSPTITPSVTPTFTPVFTQTFTFTPVPACGPTHTSDITLPPQKTANTMKLSINNPHPYPIAIGDVFVVWNNDTGHQTGTDKTLTLTSASIGATTFWTGSVSSPTTSISPNIPGTGLIPPGPTEIIFYFHQTYDNPDKALSEEILINFASNGCQGTNIHKKIGQP